MNKLSNIHVLIGKFNKVNTYGSRLRRFIRHKIISLNLYSITVSVKTVPSCYGYTITFKEPFQATITIDRKVRTL